MKVKKDITVASVKDIGNKNILATPLLKYINLTNLM
jgi:hypothetical protein